LNESAVQIELPLSLSDELTAGVKNPYRTSSMIIQQKHIDIPHGEIDDYSKKSLVTIDGREFMRENNIERVLSTDGSKNKIVQTWKFYEVNHLMDITFYIEYDLYGDFIRLDHQKELIQMDQQIYYQLNEVLRTLQIK